VTGKQLCISPSQRHYPKHQHSVMPAGEVETGMEFYLENFRAPATHAITARVTATMAGVTGSCRRVAAMARPKKGWRSCNCPTAAIPPCARPRYQKTKPISMLNSET